MKIAGAQASGGHLAQLLNASAGINGVQRHRQLGRDTAGLQNMEARLDWLGTRRDDRDVESDGVLAPSPQRLEIGRASCRERVFITV